MSDERRKISEQTRQHRRAAITGAAHALDRAIRGYRLRKASA